MDVKATEPPMGRPLSLGPAEDLADAAGLVAVLRVVQDSLGRRPPSLPNHLAREALWDLWERPRLPEPLVGSKYPLSYPWSPDARSIYQAAGGKRPPKGWGLVLEHLTPRSLLLRDLILRSEALTPGDVVEILRQGLAAAVVTKADDARLTKTGLAMSHPMGSDPEKDPWCRYKAAGIDLSRFEPLRASV